MLPPSHQPTHTHTHTPFRKTIPDSVAVRAHIEANDVKKAMVIGGGFIGLEMVENLVHRSAGKLGLWLRVGLCDAMA